MPVESNKNVSVVVVTCGNAALLARCLGSLAAQRVRPAEVVVINNNAAVTLTLPSLPFAAALRQPREDLVYCGAVNEGIGASAGAYVLVLNDDVYLDASFLAEALPAFERDARIGMVSGKILRPDGKTIDSAGLQLSYWRTARERGYGTADRGQYDREEAVFGVNGAAALYRRAMLDDIARAGFYCDPAFRIFYEDLDIAWRAQRRGWQCRYLPRAIAYHVRGATVRAGAGKGKAFARRYLSDERYADLLKNRWLTIVRNEHALGLLLHLPGIVAYDCLSLLWLAGTRPRLLKRIPSLMREIFAQLLSQDA